MQTFKQRGLFDAVYRRGLTPEQSAMVVQWRPYAIKLANRWWSCYGGNQSDWQSEALLGLCLAALWFDSSRSSKRAGRRILSRACGIRCLKLSVFLQTRRLAGMRYRPRRRGDAGRSRSDDGIMDRRLNHYEDQEVAGLATSCLGRNRANDHGRAHGRTLSEVVEGGLSRSGVRQIQDRAIVKMRSVPVERGGGICPEQAEGTVVSLAKCSAYLGIASGGLFTCGRQG